jgi:hypothetical protein
MDSYRASQGTITPSIFIGLGGTGSRIVDRVAARALRLPNWSSQLRSLTTFCSIDTNKLDQDQLKFVPDGNRILIGAFDKQTVVRGYRRSGNKLALHWLDDSYEPREGKKPGAGQIRVEARLGLFYQSPHVRERMKQLVKDSLLAGVTWRETGAKNYNVYIYCSLGGGTGSGSFLSMAYLMRNLIEEETKDWEPVIISNLLLSTLLTDVVPKKQHPDIHANTYAALKELEHMTKLNYKKERASGRQREQFAYWNDDNAADVPEVRGAPFFLSFIYDKPSNFSLHNYESAIADASFLQIFTANLANLRGAYDNEEKNLEDLTRFPGELRHVGKGYSKNFGAMGAAVMILPANELLEYSTHRFAAESLRSQITFGVDPADPANDRARALAKLAVNYNDPKFLSMRDEGRDKAINKAFIDSVREMARQDVRSDLEEGFWRQLVVGVDEGHPAGKDAKGEVLRGESVLAVVRRKLEEARRPLINRVSIRERAFSFHKEGVNQYPELVSRLKEEIRAAREIVDQGLAGLKRSASEGEVIADLKLDPVSERYLVLRLLEQCEQEWIPEAQKQNEQARLRDINNPAVAERLDVELYTSLRQAAAETLIDRVNPFRNDDSFFAARDEAQDYYRSVGASARRVFDTEIALSQFRELLEFLRSKSRQYARLARHINRVVTDLELRAEEMRKGQGDGLKYALSVEVFETLDEPRTRIWDKVYRSLYVDEGRYLSTFDRGTLASVISEQLKPVMNEDGTVTDKTDDVLVQDLKKAMIELGNARLRPAIFGEGAADWGLDLARGLTLEAKLDLEAKKAKDEPVTQAEINGYIDKKIRALAQISGVLARVKSGEWKAFDDGAGSERLRYFTHGFDPARGGRTPAAFLERMQEILKQDGLTMNVGVWHDPRIAIVYDVELPIPLYYITPVNSEIEQAYLKKVEEKKSYNLHTDKRWEETLPNLNPRSDEIAISWSIRKIAEGLVSGAVEQVAGRGFVWYPDGSDRVEELGSMLSTALYRLGELQQDELLENLVERTIQKRMQAMTAEQQRERKNGWREAVMRAREDIGLRRRRGEVTDSDVLDEPILGVLEEILLKDSQAGGAIAGGGYKLTR